MCFDEFRSSLLIGDMLDYLDCYPLALPARYANRQACYETVYIISTPSVRYSITRCIRRKNARHVAGSMPWIFGYCMEQNPELAAHIGKMDKIRQDVLEARYRGRKNARHVAGSMPWIFGYCSFRSMLLMIYTVS